MPVPGGLADYLGTTGALNANLHPSNATGTTASDGAKANEPDSPVPVLEAAPASNEVWVVRGGSRLLLILYNNNATPAQWGDPGELVLGKRIAGNTLAVAQRFGAGEIDTLANQKDRAKQNFLIPTFKVLPGESLFIGAVGDGTDGIDHDNTSHRLRVPFYRWGGLTPSQVNAAYLNWGGAVFRG